MLEPLKLLVLRLLRVPPEPSLPAGSADARVFRAAPNYYRYRLTLWSLKQLLAVIGLTAGLVALSFALDRITNPLAIFGLRTLEALAWITFLIQLPFSFAVLSLDFDLRWYIVSDRSLRIREGIFSLREKTMTFANIQNIEIRRNPLQRLLGIADVQVRTAGGGGGAAEAGHIGESLHQASFRGVDDPEMIRTAIAERVRLHRASGLGDPDDTPDAAVTPRAAEVAQAPDVVLAARDLQREMAALRRAWTG